ncbi:recombinase family protein [Microbacterium thalli]|uniref:recombinase family protein n=1 Tax=Microbacterium thalli TaxID=3027921 RepID=UPI0023661694|nr:recombinase family protein [Microbacterium thalli]MDD7929888.1 recombinase family protein [Microbacterium thalli]
MTTAALYTRISRDSEKVGKGVARQRRECTELADRLGIKIVASYEDNDISASRYATRHRPEFKRMLADAEAGKFDVLLAWDLDRLIRLPADGEKLIDLNSQAGINIRTVSESIDLTTANGRLFLRIKVDVAAHESEHKSDRIKASHRDRILDGKPISGRTPFGWKRGGLELEPAEAALVAEGVAALLSGASVTSIAREWNQLERFGRVDKREDDTDEEKVSKPWVTASVKKTLRRWRNAGVLESNGEPLDGPSQITPIVSRADLEAVRAKLELQPSDTGRPLAKSWLSGVLVCEVCGEKMLPRKDYYQCSVSTERKRAASDTARHCAVKKSIAEHQVMMALYAEANERARAGGVEPADVAKVRQIEADLLEAQQDRAEFTGLLFVKGVDRRMVEARLAELDSTITALERARIENRTASSEAARIAELMQGDLSGNTFTGAWIDYFGSLTVEEKRDLARALPTITVRSGGKGPGRVDIPGHPYLDPAKIGTHLPPREPRPSIRVLKGADLLE